MGRANKVGAPARQRKNARHARMLPPAASTAYDSATRSDCQDRTGKIPISLDKPAGAEVSVLGAILLNNAALDVVRPIVTADDFQASEHGRFFLAMVKLGERGDAIDFVTLSSELGDCDSEATQYLSAILDAVPAAANVEHYARIVKEHSVKRQLGALGKDISTWASKGRTSAEIISAIQPRLDVLTMEAPGKSAIPIGEALRSIRLDGSATTEYIPSGLCAMDNMTGGAALGELMVVGSWPGHGKSAFGQHMAVRAALNHEDGAAAFFSLEMTRQALMERVLCQLAGVSVSGLKHGTLSENERQNLEAQADALRDARLYIRHGSMGVFQIMAESKRLIKRHGVKLVVVDYAQMVRSAAPDRRLQIEDISHRMLDLATEHNVAVILLSQLRKKGQGESETPTPHDLRESAALWDAPHVIGLLHRLKHGQWEYCTTCAGQGGACPICDGKGFKTKDTTANLLISKNRNGGCGVICLSWHGPHLQFGNLSGNYA